PALGVESVREPPHNLEDLPPRGGVGSGVPGTRGGAGADSTAGRAGRHDRRPKESERKTPPTPERQTVSGPNVSRPREGPDDPVPRRGSGDRREQDSHRGWSGPDPLRFRSLLLPAGGGVLRRLSPAPVDVSGEGPPRVRPHPSNFGPLREGDSRGRRPGVRPHRD